MKRTMRIATAALFGATMLAAPALAQSDGPSSVPGTNPGASAEEKLMVPKSGAMVDTETTAAIDMDFDSAVELMGDADAASEIAAMTDVGEVRIIRFSTLQDSDESRLDQAMGESQAEINELQAAIAANSSVVAQLEAEGATPQDVLAADIAADGSLLVYTR